MKIEWSNIKKVIEGRASTQELNDFALWLNESDANRDYYEKIKNYYTDPISAEEENTSSAKNGKGGQAIINEQQKSRRITLWWSVASSAAVLLLALLVLYPTFSEDDNQQQTASQTSRVKATIILPGGVILKKENKESADIDEEISLYQNNSSLDEISYVDKSIKNITKNYHTISTPVGKNFCVELADGTRVHLNAMSELRYPTTFDGVTSREVFLKGEGYFEVTKSSTPFVVRVGGVRVKVYGTKFNVNDYDSTNVKTVLLSGSVGVSMANNPHFKEKILTPNQLATLNTTNQACEVQSINPSDFLSWKDGIIKSYNSTLGDLVVKLKNWYGVDFRFSDINSTNLPITTSFNDNQDIEEIVHAIEYILNVQFNKTEGGYVINQRVE